MSADRELLELAARAAGIELKWSSVEDLSPRRADSWAIWNPLTDDGDRYRLIQALGISIDYHDCCAWKRLRNGDLLQEFWGGDCGDEAHAILSVAAEIGRATTTKEPSK